LGASPAAAKFGDVGASGDRSPRLVTPIPPPAGRVSIDRRILRRYLTYLSTTKIEDAQLGGFCTDCDRAQTETVDEGAAFGAEREA